jgi:hypothetical protein
VSLLREDFNNRPVLLIPVSRAEKMVYRLYWLALAASIAVAILAMVYLPANPVVESASEPGVHCVRDKYALMAFSLVVPFLVPAIVSLPRYPLHRSVYFARITAENAEAQYKLGRLTSACLLASVAWWTTAAQAVLFTVWLSGRENPALMNAVLIPLALLPVSVIIVGVSKSWSIK